MCGAEKLTRSSLAIFIALACGHISLAAEPPTKQPATTKQIQQWILQLDDDDFRVRQGATENLFKSGAVAVTAVIRSLKAENPEVRLRAKSILKRWLESGDEATVETVDLAVVDLASMEKEAPKVAARIRQYRAFRWLWKRGVRVVDRYEKVASLRTLYVTKIKITDAEMSHLKAMTALKSLFLDGATITDAGFSNLKEMTELRQLRLGYSTITDAGLAHLKGMTALTKLSLRNTRITDAGLVHLKEMAKMSSLNLSNTRITDAGLAHLKEMTVLSVLHLNNTKITDAGVAHLKKLKSLEILRITNTKITDAGFTSLKSELPSLRIGTK